jgi:hypothetical protein
VGLGQTCASISGGELWDLVLGMGTTIGKKNEFGEDQTQCILCKQRDMFPMAPQICRCNVKSNVWMRIKDLDGGQICRRLEDRMVIKET